MVPMGKEISMKSKLAGLTGNFMVKTSINIIVFLALGIVMANFFVRIGSFGRTLNPEGALASGLASSVVISFVWHRVSKKFNI